MKAQGTEEGYKHNKRECVITKFSKSGSRKKKKRGGDRAQQEVRDDLRCALIQIKLQQGYCRWDNHVKMEGKENGHKKETEATIFTFPLSNYTQNLSNTYSAFLTPLIST